METSNETIPTIGEIVKNDYRTADVFKKYDIDFCCGGKKPLNKVCAEKGIDLQKIQSDINNVTQFGSKIASYDFNTWDLDFLADYIVNTHHKYVTQANTTLFNYTQKVALVHGKAHPEVVEVAEKFMEVMNELNCHMMKEENVLFPYIKSLAAAKKAGTKIAPPPFMTIQNPINMMEQEHVAAGEILGKIKSLTNNFTPPSNACATYRVSYLKLGEYLEDLMQHIHLENNILFPKAIELEKELL